MTGQGTEKDGARTWFAALAASLVAAAVRLLPFSHVFSTGQVYLFDSDCYVRLRKIFVYLNAFPATSVYDYFEGFPKGTRVITPPTMEYIIAAIAYPFRGFPSLYSLMEWFVAFLPAVIGVATVLLMFFFVRRFFSLTAAVAAALVLACYPHFVEATVLGRFDNEMVEPLMLLAISWTYATTYDHVGKGRWCLLGNLSAFYLCLWRGAVFPLSIIGIDVLIRLFRTQARKSGISDIGGGAVVMYAAAALPVAIITAANIWGTRDTFSFNIVSWFHAALFAAAAAVMFVIDGFVNRRNIRKTPVLFAGYGILTLLAVLLIAALGRNLMLGMRVVAGGDVWIDTISQYQRGLTLKELLLLSGVLSLLTPLVVLFLIRWPVKYISWPRYLVTWTIIMAAAALLRNRYAEYFGLNVALVTAIIVHQVSESARRMGPGRGRVITVSTLAAVLALQLPTYPYFASLVRNGSGYSIKGDLQDTLMWMRDNTPPPGDHFRPSVVPAYGVLARWDLGGWIETVAARPVLATIYGTETGGMHETAAFFLSETEQDMKRVLQENKVRYVLADKVTGDLPLYARLLGRDNVFFSTQWDQARNTTVYLPTARSFSLIISRLYYADGTMRKTGGFTFEPVERMRLVYESASQSNVFGFPWEIRKYKVFEYVNGASLAVRGIPGRVVQLSQEIETNQGRRFTYSCEKTCTTDGTARFSVIYSAKKDSRFTGSLGSVVISSGGRKREVRVPDQEIASGGTVTVAL